MAIIFGLLKTTGSGETTAAHDHIVHMLVAAFHDLHTLANQTFIGGNEMDALVCPKQLQDVSSGKLIILLHRKTFLPHGFIAAIVLRRLLPGIKYV
ncbi:hypothetical protein TcasGA2_TC016267 [Tribolium castaneum]|uniref:Uncharacterized protein n=1 Tax=Tribolium castaneum TaxID=7070 RepID=D6X2W8_TRICA|nr:hypothetical protein TcasGA2_TC016267 [Tribolium castaneum]